MLVQFDDILVGSDYTRQELAEHWGCAGYQALARGVVTPAHDNKIILFVTEEKQASAAPYADHLRQGRLEWEGPQDHFAEGRIVASTVSGDQVHLFHRARHHAPFTYVGRLKLVSTQLFTHQPSRFVFDVV